MVWPLHILYVRHLNRLRPGRIKGVHLVGTISITFHAASMDDLSTDIANWLSSSGRRLGITGRTVVVALEPKDQPAAIAKVVSGVHCEQSLRLLRQLADAGIQGQPVALTT